MAYKPEDSYFRNICEQAGMALVATDRQLRIGYWNPAAQRIFSELTAGEPVISIIPSERRELAQQLFESALERKEVGEFDFRYQDHTGQPTSLIFIISPITDENHQPEGISLHVSEVTR